MRRDELANLPSAARLFPPELHGNAHGSNLHAAVRWRADQRKKLEQLCRYITRTAGAAPIVPARNGGVLGAY
ncbi:MAG TPA: hypothetical protein VIB79_09015 [Candidatus Binatia bacterium]